MKESTSSAGAKRKVIAFIPARGGSKGIINKNIYPVFGKPLIEYTLDVALASDWIDEVYVSSDSDQILLKSDRPRVNCIKRCDALAADNTTTDEVLFDFISNTLEPTIDTTNTFILLLQPTSPLRSVMHLDEAVQLFFEKNPALLLSVFSLAFHPLKAFLLDENSYLSPIRDKDTAFSPRQLLPKACYPNGAIYIFSISDFLLEQCIPRENIYPYFMSLKSSIDIDSLKDVEAVEHVLDVEGAK